MDRGEFRDFLRTHTNWQDIRGYLVASTLCHRSEIEANDFFYFNDAQHGWRLIPWDHNNGNFGIGGASRRESESFMPLFGQTLQGVGALPSYWYVLPSRIFLHGELRGEYLEQLGKGAREWLLTDRITRLIDANYRRIEREVLVDPYRWPPGENRPFLRSAEDLKRFVRLHGERLLRLIDAEKKCSRSPLLISEFELGPEGGWVEIHNPGEADISLAGYTLASLEAPRRAWHRFARGKEIPAGAHEVVRVEIPESHHLGLEELERRELERRETEELERRERAERDGRKARERRPHPPEPEWVPGGTVALFRGGREREVVDAYFHSHQTRGYSYGRLESGFGFMKPTPGATNTGPLLRAPKLLADGGIRMVGGHRMVITARVSDALPGEPPESVTVHYFFVDRWRQKTMRLEGGASSGPGLATVKLQAHGLASRVFYYFVARGPNGIERRAPLDAPAGFYVRDLPGN